MRMEHPFYTIKDKSFLIWFEGGENDPWGSFEIDLFWKKDCWKLNTWPSQKTQI